jgi:hypothetical protein
MYSRIFESIITLNESLSTDIEKMKGYYAKGSDPKRLAQSVKDIDKAKNRYAIAKALAAKADEAHDINARSYWTDVKMEFKDRLRSLGFYKTDDIPPVDLDRDEFEAAKTAADEAHEEDAKNYGGGKYAFPQKIDKWLRDNGYTYNMEAIEPNHIMRSYKEVNNGRRWTIARKVEISKKGEPVLHGFYVNHTNEGGGSYGYAWSTNARNWTLGEDHSQAECLKSLQRDLSEID